ncbi:hypothetical protein SEA_LUCHADOR_17 [Mycobacterium phage Luchador]|uniref:Uncharacterized protein n=1 Tax=Mycobacterium phage Luchador TaxID=1647300 RepID=A0A0F6SJG6_9CAUD|nr:hypothetical protein AVT52_gp87 [Mycobacterium phage Luchador]AKF14182.1 hypothetical protein SEA_LUCHADOR_17 [Mycobacterium phage Luchador]
MAAVGNYEILTGTVNVPAEGEVVIAAPAGKKVLSIYTPNATVLRTYPNADGSAAVLKNPNFSNYNGIQYVVITAEMG